MVADAVPGADVGLPAVGSPVTGPHSSRRKPVRTVSFVILVIVTGLVVLLATRVPTSQTIADTPLLGRVAPSIQGTALENAVSHSAMLGGAAGAQSGIYSGTGAASPSDAPSGRQFTLSTLHGRWILIQFFASWCPPCQQEAPQLLTFAMEHRGAGGVSVVGVAFDDPRSAVVRFMGETGVIWPEVLDSTGRIAVAYGVTGPPETFLVDPAGRIVEHIDGAVTVSLLNSVLSRAQHAFQRASALAGKP
ncbi:MAG: TlpA family protein disulfide reductase [Acidimicrobiales bacterium]